MMKATMMATAVLAMLTHASQAQEGLKWFGDLRYRHEMVDEEGSETRHRHRLRTRFGVEAQVNDDVTFTTRLATGSSDPVSTNQDLGAFFSSKSIVLDQAYFTWKFDRFSVLGGKVKNPFVDAGGAQLIWDGDLTPEGLALVAKQSESMPVFVNLGGFMVRENASAHEALLAGGNVGRKFGDLTVGLGYFMFGLEGQTGTAGGLQGNTPTTPGGTVYANDYGVMELFADYSFKIGSKPAKVFADIASNSSVDDDNLAYAFGASLGSVKDKGDWKFGLKYKDVQADAVPGVFTDSDFAGGGTGGSGFVIDASVGLGKNAAFGLTYLLNTTAADEPYNRLQVDVAFKF